MFNLFDKKIIQYIALALIVIFLIDFVLLDSGQMIWLITAGVACFFSWQYYYRQEYKIIFWISVVTIAFTLMHTIFFRVILVIPLIWLALYLYQYYFENNKESSSLEFGTEPIIEEEILYSNQWFGKEDASQGPYQWQDINAQTLFGETVIDLNQTVLPKGEPIIVLRHLAGKIKIIVPYDVEVSIHHSVLIGSVDIFGYGDDQITNRVVHYQTENYQEANQRVKIYTTILAGKIEVSRG